VARPEIRWKFRRGASFRDKDSNVTIDTVGLGGVVVTATVSVSGLSKVCPAETSRSVTILPPGMACGLAFDDYGDIRFEDEKARLDNFAIQLFNDKPRKATSSFMRERSYKGEAAERLLRAKEYLVKVRSIDAARL